MKKTIKQLYSFLHILCFFKVGSRQMPSTGWIGRAGPPHSPQFRKETQAISLKRAAARSWHRPSAGPSEIETTKAGAGQTRLNAFLIQNTSSRFQIINKNFIKRGGANINACVDSKALSGTSANATFTVDWISRIRKQCRISDIGEEKDRDTKRKKMPPKKKKLMGSAKSSSLGEPDRHFKFVQNLWSLF